MRERLRSALAGGVGLVVLAGCAVGPDYERPGMDLPEQWPEELLLSEDDRAEWAGWWTRYDDPVLDGLVERALDENLEVRVQADRIQEARARLGLASAERMPTLEGQAEASRERQSEAELGGAEAFGIDRTDNRFSVTGLLGYEVDLWGRMARQEEFAEAALEESVFTHDAVRLNVVADVVATYFDLRAAERQLEITNETIASRAETLRMEQERLEGGETDVLTVRQAESELETTRARLPEQQERVETLRTALGVLVGMEPDELLGELDFGEGTLGGIALPEELPSGIPSDLLRRRPDIRAAEAGLMASTAEIGVAEADRLPRLDLTGFLGTAATETGDLFQSGSGTAGLGASVAGPLLDFGRSEARIETAEALRDQAESQYFLTVTTAFQEVRDALTFYGTSQERVGAVRRQVDALEETYRLARVRYEGGLISFIELLDVQRALLDAELALAGAVRDRLNATANLFKVMGGGWAEARDPAG